MTRWHIVDDHHLHRLARQRRLHGLLLLALGVAAGLVLDRDDGPITAAQAASAPQPVGAAPVSRDWCDDANGRSLRLSCTLAPAR